MSNYEFNLVSTHNGVEEVLLYLQRMAEEVKIDPVTKEPDPAWQ